jgi:FkbM family methyltransferase
VIDPAAQHASVPQPRKRGLFASLSRRSQERAAFASTWQWCKFVCATTLASKRTTGPKLALRLANETHPIFVRLFTSDARVVKEVLVHREYDSLLPLLASKQRSAGDHASHAVPLVIDLGSNIGCSVRAWQRWWPGAIIIAAEPDTRNHALCEENAKGAQSSVCVHRVCVADEPGQVTLDASVGAWGITMQRATTASPHNTQQIVEAITIDQLLMRSEEHIRAACKKVDTPAQLPITLLKCDIEGAEAGIFEAAERHPPSWLARVELLAVEVHPPYSVSQFKAHLASASSKLGITFEVVGDEKAGGNALVFARQMMPR